jgi:FkbM family methyltransferase
MSLGERIIKAIEKRRDRKRKSVPGPYGDFYKNGGAELLYDVPVTTGSLVIDAGGFEGEWTIKMIARYGCRSEIFEPFPIYSDYCKNFFAQNKLVRVHSSALGGVFRTTKFTFAANGTSEFISTAMTNSFKAQVIDISNFFDELGKEPVACLKLNIEGGEYEVLERLLETNQITRCQSLLIQFHVQPDGWELRLKDIQHRLQSTHKQEWSYPMVWEKWTRRNN